MIIHFLGVIIITNVKTYNENLNKIFLNIVFFLYYDMLLLLFFILFPNQNKF